MLHTKMKPECIKLRDLLTNKTSQLNQYPSIDTIRIALSNNLAYPITNKTIKNCINTWRKRFNKLYRTMKKHNLLTGDPRIDWDIVMKSFETTYGIEPMFFQKTKRIKGITGLYINPSFDEKVDISTVNLVHKLHGVATQLKNMEEYGETFILTGKSPLDLLKDAKKMETKVLDGDVDSSKY